MFFVFSLRKNPPFYPVLRREVKPSLPIDAQKKKKKQVGVARDTVCKPISRSQDRDESTENTKDIKRGIACYVSHLRVAESLAFHLGNM